VFQTGEPTLEPLVSIMVAGGFSVGYDNIYKSKKGVYQ